MVCPHHQGTLCTRSKGGHQHAAPGMTRPCSSEKYGVHCDEATLDTELLTGAFLLTHTGSSEALTVQHNRPCHACLWEARVAGDG